MSVGTRTGTRDAAVVQHTCSVFAETGAGTGLAAGSGQGVPDPVGEDRQEADQ